MELAKLLYKGIQGISFVCESVSVQGEVEEFARERRSVVGVLPEFRRRVQEEKKIENTEARLDLVGEPVEAFRCDRLSDSGKIFIHPESPTKMPRMITTLTRRDVMRNIYRESIEEIEYDPFHGVVAHIGRLDRLFWKLEMQEFPILDNYRIWALVRSLPENLRDAAHQIWEDYEEHISYVQLCTEIIHYAEWEEDPEEDSEEDPEEDLIEEPVDGFSTSSLHVRSEQGSVSWHYVSWHHEDSVLAVPEERVLVQPRQIGHVWIAIALGLVLVGVAITYLAYWAY